MIISIEKFKKITNKNRTRSEFVFFFIFFLGGESFLSSYFFYRQINTDKSSTGFIKDLAQFLRERWR